MSKALNSIPDHTAVRVALWRALHTEVDATPHVFVDKVGLQLAAPDEQWRERPDMHPTGTRGYRASIVGRARFIEDLVEEKVKNGLSQYVILGAGLDTFALRRPDLAAKLYVFEIDAPQTQAWKQRRLRELGLGTPHKLHFVPVDFEVGESWPAKLAAHDFDTTQPALVASTGVSMYLTREANMNTLRQVATLAPGSVLAMTFMLPLELIDPAERPQHAMVYERARAAGTPFISFFRPEEMLQMAREAGFRTVHHASRSDIIQKYFANRSDGLQPSSGEEFLVAST
ncbi:MAG: class I SAM-dependent methyltransferase [Bdellovibrionales bacterium]|nr:class I SAM-dependent methyltransferase [Bdellovibrionales bacterium]